MELITFSIRFIDVNSDPIAGANVQVWTSAFLVMQQSWHGFTDSDGWAEFQVKTDPPLYLCEAEATKGLNYVGKVSCDLYMNDGDTASITLP